MLRGPCRIASHPPHHESDLDGGLGVVAAKKPRDFSMWPDEDEERTPKFEPDWDHQFELQSGVAALTSAFSTTKYKTVDSGPASSDWAASRSPAVKVLKASSSVSTASSSQEYVQDSKDGSRAAPWSVVTASTGVDYFAQAEVMSPPGRWSSSASSKFDAARSRKDEEPWKVTSNAALSAACAAALSALGDGKDKAAESLEDKVPSSTACAASTAWTCRPSNSSADSNDEVVQSSEDEEGGSCTVGFTISTASARESSPASPVACRPSPEAYFQDKIIERGEGEAPSTWTFSPSPYPSSSAACLASLCARWGSPEANNHQDFDAYGGPSTTRRRAGGISLSAAASALTKPPPGDFVTPAARKPPPGSWSRGKSSDVPPPGLSPDHHAAAWPMPGVERSAAWGGDAPAYGGLNITLVPPTRPRKLRHRMDTLVTTLTINNLPVDLSRAKLRSLIDVDAGFAGCWDFLYLPYNSSNGTNQGHAIINFLMPAYAEAFFAAWHGARMIGAPTGSCMLTLCVTTNQGFELNVQNWTQQRMQGMHSTEVSEGLPIIIADTEYWAEMVYSA